MVGWLSQSSLGPAWKRTPERPGITPSGTPYFPSSTPAASGDETRDAALSDLREATRLSDVRFCSYHFPGEEADA